MAAVYGQDTPYSEFVEENSVCYYCSEEIGETSKDNPVLFWMGDAIVGDLILHPKCFLDLSTRLFSDYHKIQNHTSHGTLTGR